MMSVVQSNYNRTFTKITTVNGKIANEQKKQSDTQKKLIDLQKKLKSTKLASTVNSTLRSIDREQKNLNKATAELSKLTKQLTEEQKKLERYNKQLLSEREKENKQLLSAINSTIKSQKTIDDILQNELQKLHEQTEESLMIDNKKESVIYDVFISHSNADKDSIVTELSNRLTVEGLIVFEDAKVFKIGSSITSDINEGIKKSKFGVIILSKEFIKSNWAKYEFTGFLHRDVSGNKTVILPIWHGISYDEVKEFNPVLIDKFALNTDEHDMDTIVDAIKEVVGGV